MCSGWAGLAQARETASFDGRWVEDVMSRALIHPRLAGGGKKKESKKKQYALEANTSYLRKSTSHD